MKDQALIDSLTEMYKEWCRLKGYKPANTPFEKMIDQATGADDAHIREFLDWFSNDMLPRIYGTILANEVGAQ